MKHFPYRIPIFFMMIVLMPFISMAQRDIRTSDQHSVTTLKHLQEAFNHGNLTLDKKILYQFYALNDPGKIPLEYQRQDSLPIKCGTPLMMEYHNNRNQLSSSTVNKIESMKKSATLLTAKTFTSASGKFTIHYQTSGNDAVPSADSNQNGTPDYVEQVSAAADSSYRHEVQTLGYVDPISPGQTYTIELRDMNFYGQTLAQNGATVMQVENDFADNFPPNTDPDGDQAGDIKVTVAHEFKHAIQYATTGWGGETDDWAEMDAVLMEEVVYDNVNDYYNYLYNQDSIFLNPERSFYPGTYYQVTWAIYFEQKFGPDFWPQVWKIIENNQDITLVDAITEQLGSTDDFYRSYTESELWHYASGNAHSIANYGFEESENYPNPNISRVFLDRDSLANPPAISNFAASYSELTPTIARDGYLSLSIYFSNTMSGVGLIATFKDGSHDSKIRTIGNQQTERGVQTVETDWKWNNIKTVGIIAANGSENDNTTYFLDIYPSIPKQITLAQNYPNPFKPGTGTTIKFTLSEDSDVQLKVYDITGRLIRTLVNESQTAGFHDVKFKGGNLASGIYFYQLITNHRALVKKMTLIK